MATYVIVPGAYSGAWYLKEVGQLVQAAGHTVYRCTLTGLGERVHLASPEVGLDTHIMDVANVIAYEELQNVILVGHSYAGMVITGVAERMPERLAHLVYVDAIVPRDGDAVVGAPGSPQRAEREALVNAKGQGWLLPVDWEHGSKDWRRCPHPFKSFTQPITVQNPAATAIPRTYIYCTADKVGPDAPYRGISDSAERARAAGWRYFEVDAAHGIFRSHPRELADLLLGVPQANA